MSFVHDTIRIENRLDVLSNGKICTNNKGDMLVDDGTKTNIMSVGSNGHGLIANSSATHGIEWRSLVSSDISDFDTEVGNHTDVANNAAHVAATSNVHGVSGSLVGTNDTQTISNKTLLDSSTFFADDGDDTKKMHFQLSGVTTATTRTLTVPDSNTTIVGTGTMQTLSNKTLTSPKINDTSLSHTYDITVSELTANRSITLPLLSSNDTFVFQAHGQSLTNKTIDADSNTITNIDDGNIKSSAGIDASKVADGTVSNAEFQQLNGIGSAVVGETDTQTLSNKTLSDSSTYFADNVDSTKKMQLQLSAISTGTTRIITVPDIDTTLVGTNATQSLTNKTLDADNNTVTNIDNDNIKSSAGIDASKLADGSVSNAEFQKLNGITSDVVSVDDTQTLNNKTFVDNFTYFQDNVDGTKKVQFELSGVTTNNTRVLSVPNATTTLVGIDVTQTLTNKTIDADNNTLTNISNSAIKSSAGIDAAKLADGSVSNAEFQQLNNVNSSVVGISDTQTLSNKTLIDANTYFRDDADSTKKMQFQLSGITSSNTRVLTVPDNNTTIVGTDNNQTLTNKTWGDNLNLGSNKITNLAEPVNASDAATKNYVDVSAQGLDAKSSVRVKTQSALPTYTQSGAGVGATLTADANGALPSIDGVTLVANDRLLVDSTGTTSDVHNGIYVVTQVGDGSNPWILTRAADADQDAEVTAGMYTFVTEGTISSDSGYILTTNNPITVDTTILSFTQFSGAGQITGGDGLTKTDNTLDIGGSATIIANADNIEVNSSNVANQILLSSGTVGSSATYGAIPLANSNSVSGILPLSNGGTNVSSFSAGSRLITTNSGNTALETTSLSENDIVTLSTAQVLTNKTLTDNTTYFQDNADNTKKMQFELSGISTATTRTVTMPDTNITLVGESSNQTLANKTIDADNNTVTNIDNTCIKSGAAIDATKIANGSVTNTEFQYLNSVTSNVQTQLDDKIPYSETNLISLENGSPGGSNHVKLLLTKSHNGSDDYNLGIDSDPVKFIITAEDGTYRQATVFSGDTYSTTATIFGVSSSSNSGSTWNPRFIVRQDGKVGFGTTSPSEILDVQGNIALTGTVDGRNIATDGSTLDSHVAATSAHGVSGNIVGTSDTQTMTNKSLDDATTYIIDNADNTKKVQFQLSSLTTATTRVITIPDTDLTLVGTVSVQTLTNKTLDADNNTVTNIDNDNIKSNASIDASKIADGTVSNTEFQRLNGISSAVVGVNDTQTLVNKTFTDDSTYFQDNSDNSKKMQFELSGLTASTTRVLTVPNASTTLVGDDFAQTLTNKTINSDSNTITNISDGDIKSGANINAAKIADGTVSSTEFQRLNGIGSSVVGISDTQTLTNKTLTSPKIDAAINDTNGNELIKVVATNSAVNELTVTNTTTGNGPILSATGNDTNIDLNLTPKGSGKVILDNHSWPNSDGSADQVIKTDGSGNLSFANVDVLSIGTVTTTTNAATTIVTTETATDNVYLAEFSIVGRRTDSGTEAAGFVIKSMFRNDGGILTKVGDDKFYARDDSNWDANAIVSGTDIILQVTGETSKTINWKATNKITTVG